MRRKGIDLSRIYRSFRAFVIVLSVASIVFHHIGGEDVTRCCLAFVPVALLFPLCAAAVIRSRGVIVIFLEGVLSTALGALTGHDMLTWSVGAAGGFLAFLIALRERRMTLDHINRDNDFRKMSIGISLFIFILISAAALFYDWLYPDMDVGQWLFGCSMAFVPLCIAAWISESADICLDRFYGKTAQPISLIKRTVRFNTNIVFLLVLAGAMLVPFSASKSIASRFAHLVKLLLKMLVMFLSRFIKEPDAADELDFSMEEIDDSWIYGDSAAYVDDTAEGGVDVVAIIGAVFLACAVIAGISILVISLIRAFASNAGARVNVLGGDPREDSDEIAHVAIRRRHGSEEKLGKDARGRIRSVYRRKMRALRRSGVTLTGCETAEDIEKIAAQKQKDIAGLTQLYQAARYGGACTEQDAECAEVYLKR